VYIRATDGCIQALPDICDEGWMDIKERIKKVLQEAEIYRSQGLMAEAQTRYQNAVDLVSSIEKLKNKDSLLNAIQDKIDALNNTQQKVEKKSATPELSKKAQDLIKNLFTFSENKDESSASLEGAIALAKFGQFDRAMTELNVLLKKENVRVDAAKNILRCHLAASSGEEAINQYNLWFAGDLFQSAQLEAVRIYLEDILTKRGIAVNLPSPVQAPQEESLVLEMESPQLRMESPKEEPPESEEEFLDITSIGITFESGPSKGRMIEFDVNFQSGNTLSLIIPKKDREIIEEIAEGTKLKDVQCFSPIAIFNGTGLVASKTQIKAGPKQGDFCLDIRISSA
jgi:tetratricopeptide (TPR) repeat protein